jgi:hypothetical protein
MMQTMQKHRKSRHWGGTTILALLAVVLLFAPNRAGQLFARMAAETAVTSPQLYYPVVYKQSQDGAGGTWNSSLAVQNLGQATATVAVHYFQENGVSIVTANRTIPAGDSILISLEDVPELPAIKVAAVIMGDQPLAGVSWVRRMAGSVGSQGIYNAAGAQTATTVYVPWVSLAVQGSGGYNSNLAIQNLSATQPAQVRLHFYNTNGALVAPPMTSPVFGPSSPWFPNLAQSGLPADFTGSVVAESLQIGPTISPIAVVDNKLGGSAGFAMLSHSGLPAGATELFADGLFTSNTAITLHVQNTSANQPATVTVENSDSVGNTQFVLPPLGRGTVEHASGSHGSAFTTRLSSTAPIAAIVVQQNTGGAGSAFEAATGVTGAAFPLQMKNGQLPSGGPAFNSSINLVNPISAQAQAQASVRYSSGLVVPGTINPGQTQGLPTQTNGSLPSPFIGSASMGSSLSLFARASLIPAAAAQGDYISVYRGDRDGRAVTANRDAYRLRADCDAHLCRANCHTHKCAPNGDADYADNTHGHADYTSTDRHRGEHQRRCGGG